MRLFVSSLSQQSCPTISATLSNEKEEVSPSAASAHEEQQLPYANHSPRHSRDMSRRNNSENPPPATTEQHTTA